jgi:hypothetical protein
MRKWLISAAAAFALSFGGTPAFAQQVTPATVQEAARFGSMHQAAYMRILGIFETMPTYPEERSGVDSGKWLAQSRNWIGASRAVIAEVRMSMAAMPSIPSGLPDRLRQALTVQERRFPEIISGVEQFVSRFSGELDAIERGDEGGAQKMAVSAMDAASFTVGIMRDINVAQADFVGESHPQTYFLRSVARSYDAMLAVFALGRANLVGEAVDRASAARTVTEAASDMRQYVEAGAARSDGVYGGYGGGKAAKFGGSGVSTAYFNGVWDVLRIVRSGAGGRRGARFSRGPPS